jgi:hypothetical protein
LIFRRATAKPVTKTGRRNRARKKVLLIFDHPNQVEVCVFLGKALMADKEAETGFWGSCRVEKTQT